MDILAAMKKSHPKRKRPAVLVRFYADDLARLNAVCAQACTPRENYCRRVIMLAVNEANLTLLPAGAKRPGTLTVGPDGRRITKPGHRPPLRTR